MVLCLSLLGVPVARGAEPQYVALTFDDGPSGRFTRRLLDGLAERGVQATFLLCGYRLEEYGALAQRIYAEGHEIGLHGYSHKDMGKMTCGEIQAELRATLALLPEGCHPAFLRPPGGSVSPAVAEAARAQGLGILNWAVDPRDWATRDPASVETAVLKQVRDGDVILLHDMGDSSVEAALYIVDRLLEQGFCLVTASRLAALRGVEIEPGASYFRFPCQAAGA